ncbi:MAG TPA: hypothetical protein VF230_01565 [Acidimicrobiales bacterium]
MTPRNDDRAEPLHEHAAAAGAPGASGPGEPGYEGEVTVGEDAGLTGTGPTGTGSAADAEPTETDDRS